MTLKLTSEDFQHGQPIPKICTGEGKDRSPELTWSTPPQATQEMALICEDPDAPTPKPWVHWVIYGLTPDVMSLPAGIPPDPILQAPVTARQGKNSWEDENSIGYRGPMPPPGHGVHHYHFRLYALDTRLAVEPGATQEELLQAMQGHVLATGQLTGTYERKK
ncbi:MAG: YbhB/YbcL family Raf kinase inhibitor-like protein [Pirellulaceae bacterium]